MRKLKKALPIFFGGILVGIAVISNTSIYPLLIAMGIFILLYVIVK
jgi:hypothetical protein